MDATPLDAAVPRVAAMLVWAAAAACALSTVVILYPGQFPYDSANQLWQARTGRFGDGSPVAMVALWSVLLDVTGNPATLFILNVALYWTGLALCMIAVGARPLAGIAMLVAMGLAPLGLAQMAHVLTDAHLAAVLMLATGFAAWGLAARRCPPLIACGVLLVYAGCVRHNALFATVPLAAILGASAASTQLRGFKAGAMSAAAIVLVTLLIAYALDRTLVSRRIVVWPTLALWDLAAISVDVRTLLLPPFTHGPGMTTEELEETGAFDPTVNVALFQRSRAGVNDGYDAPYSPAERQAIFHAWFAAVREHPLAYARHRLRTFGLLIGPHRGPVQSVAYFELRVPFKDNPALPEAWAPRLQAAFYRVAAALRPGWLFAALPYLLLALVVAVVGWRRRDRPTGRAALAASGSALLYTVGYIPLAPAADLRYLTWPIVVAPVALVLALSRRGCVGPVRRAYRAAN